MYERKEATMSNYPNESNPQARRKSGTGMTVLILIFAVILCAVISYAVTSFYNTKNFQLDFRANVATIDTSSIIQQYQLLTFQGMQTQEQQIDALPQFKEFVDTMQDVVDQIQTDYNIILLERGAVPSRGFHDFSDELKSQLIAKGFTFLRD
jgi:uncharacterized protein HemX